VITADPPETKEVFRQLRYLTPPERPSATFIEDAYRRAVAATLGELSGEEPGA